MAPPGEMASVDLLAPPQEVVPRALFLQQRRRGRVGWAAHRERAGTRMATAGPQHGNGGRAVRFGEASRGRAWGVPWVTILHLC